MSGEASGLEAADLGRRGAEAVRARYTAEAMARATADVYEGVLRGTGRPDGA